MRQERPRAPSKAMVATVTLAVIHMICALRWGAAMPSTKRLDEAFARAISV